MRDANFVLSSSPSMSSANGMSSPQSTAVDHSATPGTYKSPFDFQVPTPHAQTFQTQTMLTTRRWRWRRPKQADGEFFAARCLPLLLHVTALTTLLGGFLRQSASYLTVKQVSGNGRLDYYIMNSCATVPGAAQRMCTPRSFRVDYMPSLLKVSDYIPGVVAVQIPFASTEAPPILLTAIILLFLSLALYFILWLLAFYPANHILPGRLVRFARYRSRQLFWVTGGLSFASTVLTLTISLGYKLYFIGYRNKINQTMQVAAAYGMVRGTATVWRATLGSGFDILWVSTAFQVLTVLAVNVAMRYGMDEKVEWPEDTKENDAWA
ncbi:hypothetical protein OIO90_001284 [Microbotryomycetes sp. JL221]|nr:hypothetical protein OIO90_001284 [Microbotryomycetes sp. JL221]